MAYQRSISTLGCPEASLPEALALARRHGLDAIELRVLGGSLNLAGQLAAACGSPAAFSEALGDTHVRVAALDSSLKLAEAGEKDFEELAELAVWAEAAGVPRLRVFDGGEKGDDAELARAAGSAARWRELRSRRSWRTDIMVETHDSLFTAEKILRFAKESPGTPILWDSHHTWRRGGEDPLLTWRAIRDLVVHIHLKDSAGLPGRHGYAYVLPGSGEFPMAPLRAALHADFGGVASLEWEKYWRPDLPSLEDALTSATRVGWW